MLRFLGVGLGCAFSLACGGAIIDGGGNGSDAGSNGDAGADAALCTLSTDCGTSSVQACVANSCPGNAACILFVPRGSFSDRIPASCAVSSCIATCESSSDCSEGYECVSPQSAPWSGGVMNLDDDRAELVCLPSSCGSP